jgi:hypothetical protein
VGGFSLIEGGPLLELGRSARFVGGKHHVFRRSVLIALVGWAPALVLGLAAGTPRASLVPLHTRFLLSIPVLLASETFINARVREAVSSFLERGLVSGDEATRFRAIADESRALFRSRGLLLVCVGVAFGVSLLGDLTGYARRGSPYDWWLAYVSLPLFRMVLFAWLARWGVWAVFLVRVAGLDLTLVPTHPDLVGGIGFLEPAARSFLLVHAALGAAFAGGLVAVVASKRDLVAALSEPVAGFTLIGIVIVLGPLLAFVPKLLRARWRGQLEYGAFAYRHNRLFGEKWSRPSDESPLGAPSISSLADLGTSYGFVDRMRLVPFGRLSAMLLAVVCLAPAFPAALSQVPLREMVTRVVKGLLF